MPKGAKFGGRQKGTPNKATAAAQEVAARLGVDPFEVLLLFAKEDWKALGYEAREKERFNAAGSTTFEFIISPELRQRAAEKACEYLRPKLKAMEVSINPEVATLLQNLESKTDSELLDILKNIKHD